MTGNTRKLRPAVALGGSGNFGKPTSVDAIPSACVPRASGEGLNGARVNRVPMRVLFLSERTHGRFDMVDDAVGRPFFLAKYLSKHAELEWMVLTDRPDVPAVARRDLGFGPVEIHNVRGPGGFLPLRYPWFFRAVVGHCRRRSPDVVLATREMGEILCGIASARVRDLPCVVDFTDNYATYRYGWNQARPQDWVLRHGTLFSSASPSLREMISGLNPRAEVYLLPNGYEPSAVPGESKAALRRRLGIADGARVVLYAGQLRTSKGTDALLETVRLAREGLSGDFLLVLVGPLMGDDTRFAGSLPDGTRAIGPVPRAEALRWMRSADVGILPYPATRFSHYGFPLKLFEFLSSGLRVVTTPTPSALWIASQFPEVFVSRDFEPAGIAESLVRALEAVPSGAHGPLEAYAWDPMVGSFVAWIESHLPGSSRRSSGRS